MTNQEKDIARRMAAIAETLIAVALLQPPGEEEAAWLAENLNGETDEISRRLFWEWKTGINDW